MYIYIYINFSGKEEQKRLRPGNRILRKGGEGRGKTDGGRVRQTLGKSPLFVDSSWAVHGLSDDAYPFLLSFREDGSASNFRSPHCLFLSRLLRRVTTTLTWTSSVRPRHAEKSRVLRLVRDVNPRHVGGSGILEDNCMIPTRGKVSTGLHWAGEIVSPIFRLQVMSRQTSVYLYSKREEVRRTKSSPL